MCKYWIMGAVKRQQKESEQLEKLQVIAPKPDDKKFDLDHLKKVRETMLKAEKVAPVRAEILKSVTSDPNVPPAVRIELEKLDSDLPTRQQLRVKQDKIDDLMQIINVPVPKMDSDIKKVLENHRDVLKTLLRDPSILTNVQPTGSKVLEDRIDLLEQKMNQLANKIADMDNQIKNQQLPNPSAPSKTEAPDIIYHEDVISFWKKSKYLTRTSKSKTYDIVVTKSIDKAFYLFSAYPNVFHPMPDVIWNDSSTHTDFRDNSGSEYDRIIVVPSLKCVPNEVYSNINSAHLEKDAITDSDYESDFIDYRKPVFEIPLLDKFDGKYDEYDYMDKPVHINTISFYNKMIDKFKLKNSYDGNILFV